MQRSFNSSGPHYHQKHSPGERINKERQFPAEFPGGVSAVTFPFLFGSEVSRRLTEASNAISGLPAALLGKQCINGVKTCSSQALFWATGDGEGCLLPGGRYSGRTHNSGESAAWFTSNAWKWASSSDVCGQQPDTCLEPCCIRRFLRPVELGEKGDRQHLSYPAQSNRREVQTAHHGFLPLIDSDNFMGGCHKSCLSGWCKGRWTHFMQSAVWFSLNWLLAEKHGLSKQEEERNQCVGAMRMHMWADISFCLECKHGISVEEVTSIIQIQFKPGYNNFQHPSLLGRDTYLRNRMLVSVYWLPLVSNLPNFPTLPLLLNHPSLIPFNLDLFNHPALIPQ